MSILLGFNGVILTLVGVCAILSICLFIHKNKQFKHFDQSSENFIEELYRSFESLHLAEIKNLCIKEGSVLSHLTQNLLEQKDQYNQIDALEKVLATEKKELDQKLDLFIIIAWVSPLLSTITGFSGLILIFTETELILKQVEQGPITIALHILLCIGIIGVGLLISLTCIFMRHNLKIKARKLITELEDSGDEIMSLIQEVKKG